MNSDREPPIVFPWPHIVSRTGITVDVSLIADVRASASRARASGRGVPFVLTGLEGVRGRADFGVKFGAAGLTGSYRV